MIGSMNERVIFQAPNKLPNGQGGFKLDRANPIVIGEFWAAVEVLKDYELLRYVGRQSQAELKITIRENRVIDKRCQVVWNGRTLDIDEITPHKKSRGYMTVYALEAVK